jgi:lipoprotein NlpD
MVDCAKQWLVIGLWAVSLAGCAPHLPVRVEDRGQAARQPESDYREVVAGDTLYSIAWESGRDYRTLAAWNNIPHPYVIKPGQRIRLRPPEGVSPSRPVQDVRVVRSGDTLYRIATEAGVSTGELAAWNNISPPYRLNPGQKLRLTPPVSSVGPALAGEEQQPKTAVTKTEGPDTQAPASSPSSHTPAPPKVPAASRAVAKSPSGRWSWPADGVLLERFGSNKGIDIGGKKGQAIRAAADGRVVYQGSGLRGYGELIIIKHNAEFLSAYAHSSRIYVKEGDVVKRDQRIAEMGSSGTDRVKLHFEIRFRGNPVDPLEHLPKQ